MSVAEGYCLKFLLENSCFTMLCYFLWYSKVNQLYVYMYIYPLFFAFPPHLCHHRALSRILSMFSLVTYLERSSVYMSIPISQFVLPPIFPLGVHTFVLCTSVSALKTIYGFSLHYFPPYDVFLQRKRKEKKLHCFSCGLPEIRSVWIQLITSAWCCFPCPFAL